MTNDRLKRKITALETVAAAAGGLLRYHINPPTTPKNVRPLQELFDLPIPQLLLHEWGQRDGFWLAYTDPEDLKAGAETDRGTYRFEIDGVAASLIRTRRAREYIAKVNTPEDPIYDRALDRHVLAFADVRNFDTIILAKLDEPGNSLERLTIFELEKMDFNLAEPVFPIAYSIDEYIERSLDYMAKTLSGFEYYLD